MRINQVICDRCGRPDASEVSIVTCHYSDAAGSSSDKTLDADICANCKLVLFDRLLYSLPQDVANKFLESLECLATSKSKRTHLFVEHP